MDAALSRPVSGALSTERTDAAPAHVCLSLDAMESVLRHWESLDAVQWDDETRMECSTFIEEQAPVSVEAWKALLVKVPDQVEERYRKVMQLLLDKRLIDQAAFEAELAAMPQLSPGALTRRGKLFADWYRETP